MKCARRKGWRGAGLAMAAVGLAVMLGPAPVPAQAPPRKVTVVFASTNFPVGTSPANLPKTLGYWQEEGLDVELQGAAGSLPSLQMVLGGKGDVGVVQPITLFQMRPKGAKVKAFYTFIRHNWFYPVVLESSPILSIKDLKGKTIGVQSMGASMIPFMKLCLAEAGLDPEKDATFVGVGLGAGAAALLHQGKVDALALWSAQYALMENAGFKLRSFQDIAPLKHMSFAVSYVARDDWIRDNGEVAARLGRGWAKATLFALTNPEAAVRLHWKVYPQTRAAGDDDPTAMKKALTELWAGLNFMRVDTAPSKKWGLTTREEVEAYGKVLVRAKLMEGQPEGADQYFAPEMIDRINDFDQAKVIAQARAFKP
ncbi:MAG: ABC transporter substrate-binding protein [Candidatus Rokubacteria bacterium]|nr:ABC transporter substrate-binding protein [Candidatus Rokubacteria bacterium]